MRYSQIDWQAETIEIIAPCRKGGRRIHPLNRRAVEILKECASEDEIDITLRPADRNYKDKAFYNDPALCSDVSKAMANLNMGEFIRTIDHAQADKVKYTLHGFRYAFRRWARKTVHHESTVEMCMGHIAAGNKVQKHICATGIRVTQSYWKKSGSA